MKKYYLVLLFLLFFLVGCGSSNRFIGTWYHVEDDDVVIITFYDNNKCYLEEFDEETECTYKYDNKKIYIDSFAAETELNYNFIDDYVVIGDVRFYKDMKKAKDNQDTVGIHQKKVEGKLEKKFKVPDVTGMDVKEAEKILNAEGFEVEIVKELNNFYAEGIVIKTTPASGRIVDKGTTIKMHVSTSSGQKVIIEDYVGMNYLQVKAKLETLYNMKVDVIKIDSSVTENNDNKSIEDYENLIIRQSIDPGTEITIYNDDPPTITLYIPRIKEG